MIGGLEALTDRYNGANAINKYPAEEHDKKNTQTVSVFSEVCDELLYV